MDGAAWVRHPPLDPKMTQQYSTIPIFPLNQFPWPSFSCNSICSITCTDVHVLRVCLWKYSLKTRLTCCGWMYLPLIFASINDGHQVNGVISSTGLEALTILIIGGKKKTLISIILISRERCKNPFSCAFRRSLYLIIVLYTLVFFPIFSHDRGIDGIRSRINNDDFQSWKVISVSHVNGILGEVE